MEHSEFVIHEMSNMSLHEYLVEVTSDIAKGGVKWCEYERRMKKIDPTTINISLSYVPIF